MYLPRCGWNSLSPVKLVTEPSWLEPCFDAIVIYAWLTCKWYGLVPFPDWGLAHSDLTPSCRISLDSAGNNLSSPPQDEWRMMYRFRERSWQSSKKLLIIIIIRKQLRSLFFDSFVAERANRQSLVWRSVKPCTPKLLPASPSFWTCRDSGCINIRICNIHAFKTKWNPHISTVNEFIFIFKQDSCR